MQYTSKVIWNRNNAIFSDNRYSRKHVWQFDGGIEVPASSSPQVVRVPLSEAAAVDPEEAFVASLASCHMLWFLDIAARAGFVIDSYVDDAVGTLAKNSGGKLAMTIVTLKPHAIFSGDKRPSRDDIERMHHKARDECFIATSVKSEVRCEPVFD
jgi:organic hydroperoxide reductase OsmC/OhrA